MKTELTIITIIALLLFVSWSIVDNQSYFGLFEVKAATDAGTATLDLSVTSSITLTIEDGASIDFGPINPGTPEQTKTTLVKTLSNDTITLAVGRDREDPGHTLASNADPTNIYISDTAGGIDAFDGTGSSTDTWVDASSTGLGFTLWAATNNKDTTIWGTGTTVGDDLNKYAALQASVGASTAWATTTTGTLYASVGYSIDVASDQQATAYTGDVVFTGTTTP